MSSDYYQQYIKYKDNYLKLKSLLVNNSNKSLLVNKPSLLVNNSNKSLLVNNSKGGKPKKIIKINNKQWQISSKSFNVFNPKMFIFDPSSYNMFKRDIDKKLKKIRFGIILDKVVNGTWKIYTQFRTIEDDKRLTKLLLVNDNYLKDVFESDFEYVKDIGVDSAQIALFDDINKVRLEKYGGFYAVFKNGIITETGLGDGYYPVYVSKKQNKVNAVLLDFSEHPLI